MFIQKIRCKNYKQFKESLEVDLEQMFGRIGILGFNGSGKSTLLSIIPIALYGLKAIDVSKNFLRTQGLSKETVMIGCDFATTDQLTGKLREFSIKREFKGQNLTTKVELLELVNGKHVCLANSLKEVESYISKLLNMNFEVFSNTVYCKQKELANLSNMDSSERKKLILKITGVEKLEEELKQARRLKEGHKKHTELLAKDLLEKEKIQSQITTANEEIINIKILNTDIYNKLQSHTKVLVQNEKLLTDLDSKYEEFNTTNMELQNTDNSLNFTDKELLKISNDLDIAKKASNYMLKEGNSIIQEFSKKKELFKKLSQDRLLFENKKNIESRFNETSNELLEIKSEIVDIKNKAKETTFSKEALAEINQELEKTTTILENTKEDLHTQDKLLSKYDTKLLETTEELSKMSDMENCKCFVCHQTVSKEHVEIITAHYLKIKNEAIKRKNAIISTSNQLKELLSTETNKLTQLKNKEKALKQAEVDLNNLFIEYNAKQKLFKKKQEENKTLETRLKEVEHISFDENLFNETNLNLNTLEGKFTKLSTIKEKADSVDTIEKHLTSNQTKKQVLIRTRQELVDKLTALNFDKTAYIKQRNLYKELLNEKEIISNKHLDIQKQLSKKEEGELRFLTQLLDTILKKETEYNIAMKELSDYIILEENLSKTKASIISRMRPLINKHFADIFTALIDYKYEDIELNENYDIMVQESGEMLPLLRLSGGEQDIANLSLRLALSKFLTEMHNGVVEFVILDEIFGSLDDSRKAALIDLLKGLADLFKQIFVVSHEEVIKKSLDYCINVEENNLGYSELIN